eukprot:3934113-Rhodomonas_salina.1
MAGIALVAAWAGRGLVNGAIGIIARHIALGAGRPDHPSMVMGNPSVPDAVPGIGRECRRAVIKPRSGASEALDSMLHIKSSIILAPLLSHPAATKARPKPSLTFASMLHVSDENARAGAVLWIRDCRCDPATLPALCQRDRHVGCPVGRSAENHHVATDYSHGCCAGHEGGVDGVKGEGH